jgi:hypothetical protein
MGCVPLAPPHYSPANASLREPDYDRRRAVLSLAERRQRVSRMETEVILLVLSQEGAALSALEAIKLDPSMAAANVRQAA